MNSLVSIGVPVFNDFAFIEDSLNSLLNQTYSPIEIFISDDNSSDGCSDICKKYAESYEHVKYFRQKENIGISRNMTFLLRESQGEYFMWAGDDDIFHPDFVRLAVEAFSKDSDLSMVFPEYRKIDDFGNEISSSVFYDFSANSVRARLRKFIRQSAKDPDADAPGYSMFRKSRIENVHFPIWKWPNKRRAHNNIYPPMCYFLSAGNYKLLTGFGPLWYNRIKSGSKHQVPYKGKPILHFIAFVLWRMNVIYCCQVEILRNKKTLSAFSVLGDMIYFWFVITIRRKIIPSK